MQLCECCKKLDTCQLEKRRPDRRPPEVQQKHDPQINLQYSLSPCDAFELVCRFSQDRYERIKKLVHRARAAAKASSSRETIHLDIPLEIGTEDYHHSDVLEAFLNVDFDAESEYESFITHYVGPHFPRQVSNLLDLRDRMKQAQDKLRPLFEGKSDPNNLEDTLRQINEYLSWSSPQIYVDKEGVKSRTLIRVPGGVLSRHLAPLSLLSVKTAELLSKGQVLKRCPECSKYFIPPRTGPAGATCPKAKCKKRRQRRKQKQRQQK